MFLDKGPQISTMTSSSPYCQGSWSPGLETLSEAHGEPQGRGRMGQFPLQDTQECESWRCPWGRGRYKLWAPIAPEMFRPGPSQPCSELTQHKVWLYSCAQPVLARKDRLLDGVPFRVPLSSLFNSLHSAPPWPTAQSLVLSTLCSLTAFPSFVLTMHCPHCLGPWQKAQWLRWGLPHLAFGES